MLRSQPLLLYVYGNTTIIIIYFVYRDYINQLILCCDHKHPYFMLMGILLSLFYIFIMIIINHDSLCWDHNHYHFIHVIFYWDHNDYHFMLQGYYHYFVIFSRLSHVIVSYLFHTVISSIWYVLIMDILNYFISPSIIWVDFKRKLKLFSLVRCQ